MTQRREDPAAIAAEFAPTAQCLLRDGRFTYANEAMGDLLGVDAELEGKAFADVVTDPDRVLDALADHSQDDANGSSLTVRFDVETGARRSRTIESRWRVADAMGPDGEGSESFVGTFDDVTDRVELERESEMLGSALENLPMSIYFKDRQSRHERVSEHLLCQDKASVITNGEGKEHHHQDDVVGKTDFDVYSGDWVEGAVEEDQQVMESEEPIVNEVAESRTNLGETFFSSTTKAPRYDGDGNVVGIVGVTMDVTDRMTYERELERQNDRMEEFTEVLTHDLRNPLTVATGYANALADRHGGTETEKLTDSLERMTSLITEIRAFVLEGRSVESPDPVELAVVARDAWGSVNTPSATLDVDATHTIRADDCRVKQLFENLYGNAVEHGGDDVVVTVGDLDDGFYVADDGPGIPDEDRDYVFERGFTTDRDSTGFGLAIVKNTADAHDWTVSVTEAAAGGARFEFRDVVRVEDDAGSQH